MIGVFDSGIGGLTVLKHIHKRLPQYSTIYLGDSMHTPYGVRTHEEITELTWIGVKWLFDRGCSLVILACNSASAQALRTIQQERLGEYPDRNVLGVIRPTAEELARRYSRVGVLATSATVASKSYVRELKKINPEIKITQHACPRWVSIVESGEIQDESTMKIIQSDVNDLLEKDPDVGAVLLGCTHYPHLYDQIRVVLPENIELYDQGPIVAEKLENYLKRHPEIESQLNQKGSREYFETKSDGVVGLAEFEI